MACVSRASHDRRHTGYQGRPLRFVPGLAVGIALCVSPAASAATSCEGLAALSLPNTTLTLTQSVAPGAFKPPVPAPRGGGAAVPSYTDLPAFCRVTATLRPSSDSDIKMELWMPASGWNGKFIVPGNGGFAGSIGYAPLATNLRLGYAVAATDTGHEGGSGSFMLGHPEKTIDFADRAIHEVTVKSKAMTAAYYGNGPKLSYFNGCSTGGRQALAAAQRHPEDFDGIIAGAPGINAPDQSAGQIWFWNALLHDQASLIPPAKLAVLHNAVLQACDALDGVKDGVLEDPTRCKFDPKVLQCKGADGANCLTAAQVEAARKVYQGPINPHTKKQIFSPLYPGSELGWPSSPTTPPVGYALDVYRFMVFKDANWDPTTLDYDSDVALAEKTTGLLNNTDPDLRKFVGHMGKLIMYQGWAEPGIPPGYIPEYYKNVVSKVGEKTAQNAVRLFMVPGMGHCRGGGTDTFDMLSALEAWAERGQAPDSIPASMVVESRVVRTRPLCPYPEMATYKGSGSTDDAANFVCKIQR
jgi:feruloyl esterase